MIVIKCVQERGGWVVVVLRVEERSVVIRGSLGMRSSGSWFEYLFFLYGVGQWVKLSFYLGFRGDRVRDGRVWSSFTFSGQLQCILFIEYFYSFGVGFQRRNFFWEEGRMRYSRSLYIRERLILRKRCVNRINKQENF